MRFEVLTAVEISMLVFLVVIPCKLAGRCERFFSPEDGGSVFLRNVGIYLQIHSAWQPRRPTSTLFRTTFPWFPELPHSKVSSLRILKPHFFLHAGKDDSAVPQSGEIITVGKKLGSVEKHALHNHPYYERDSNLKPQCSLILIPRLP
jgi:hypothetical protein